MELYDEIVKEARVVNKKLGYGDDSNKWKKKDYNCTNRMLKNLTNEKFRIKNKALFYKELEYKVKKEELKMLKKLQKAKK